VIRLLVAALVLAWVVGLAVPLPATAEALPPASNSLGLMPYGTEMTLPDRLALARELGVAYFRPTSALLIGREPEQACPECDLVTAAGLKPVVSVRNAPPGQAPSTPAATAAYGAAVERVGQRYRPALLVVENEENSEVFYAGTPAQYVAQLRVACEAAHRAGIPCTNGGLVESLVVILTWADLVERAEPQAACAFVQGVADERLAGALCAATSPAEAPARVRDQLAQGRELLAAYRQLAAEGLLDYVNFHWYHLHAARRASAAPLRTAVTYLAAAVQAPLLSNEIGQFDEAPESVEVLLREAARLQLPLIVWFSQDVSALGSRARALTEPDGSLRPNGAAFARFVREHASGVEGHVASTEAVPLSAAGIASRPGPLTYVLAALVLGMGVAGPILARRRARGR
jgi:hypothetical protein